MLLVKLTTIGQCVDFQLVLADTTGSILDTVYTPPPRTPLNFKLAPNDSLLLLKTYDDDCTGAGANFKYTFYDRYLKTALPDTIKVRKARGLPLRENVWSPDSRKVIISQWAGRQVKASVYDVISKDTIYIDRGADFVWSPTDNEVVGYVKDYSVYTKNIVTGEEKVIFEGKKKREATDFRWSPDGETLMVHVRTYLLNIQSNMSQANHIIYVSMKDGRESRTYYDGQRIDTWIGPPGD